MTSLEDIEKLEHQCVDVMARADTPPTQRGQLAGTLAKIRALKKEYLLAHPGVLRKSTTKLHTWPLDRDQPNAKNPDEAVGSDPLVFRAPPELRDLTIVTVNGTIHVPAHGVVETNPDHTELHAELRGRGFKQLHSVDRFGKSANGADLAQMFARDALQPIGSSDLFKGPAARALAAAAVPSEMRHENFDGPGPAATFAGSLAAFRKKYFGEE
jgi:hypothetical protein